MQPLHILALQTPYIPQKSFSNRVIQRPLQKGFGLYSVEVTRVAMTKPSNVYTTLLSGDRRSKGGHAPDERFDRARMLRTLPPPKCNHRTHLVQAKSASIAMISLQLHRTRCPAFRLATALSTSSAAALWGSCLHEGTEINFLKTVAIHISPVNMICQRLEAQPLHPLARWGYELRASCQRSHLADSSSVVRKKALAAHRPA